jgi:UDP-glucose 4-epimerase
MRDKGKILVTGGAGYIGSHVVEYLHENGLETIVLDNLSTGSKSSVLSGQLIEGDIADKALLEGIFHDNYIISVMHFAAHINVGESVQNPAKYYHNNLYKALTLLDTCVQNNISNFIFSSTAAVYGEPEYNPVDLKHRTNPMNPYGQSKLMFEKVIEDYGRAYGLKYAILRYFNAAGLHPSGLLGESKEDHRLIPIILQVASGIRQSLQVYGNQFDTPDGTCVRDYIHVQDLSSAHFLAYQYLLSGNDSIKLNLGAHQGYSVYDVVRAAEKVTQVKIPYEVISERIGDPAIVVADYTEAKKALAWSPESSSLEQILRDAWHWYQQTKVKSDESKWR